MISSRLSPLVVALIRSRKSNETVCMKIPYHFGNYGYSFI